MTPHPIHSVLREKSRRLFPRSIRFRIVVVLRISMDLVREGSKYHHSLFFVYFHSSAFTHGTPLPPTYATTLATASLYISRICVVCLSPTIMLQFRNWVFVTFGGRRFLVDKLTFAIGFPAIGAQLILLLLVQLSIFGVNLISVL